MTPRVDEPFASRVSEIGLTLCSEPLSSVAPHAFTTRALTFTGDRADDDWRRLAASLSLEAEHLIGVRQVHGRVVCVVEPGAAPTAAEADAVVSFDPDRGVAVRVADCVPVLLADRRGRAVAAIHAGWRGSCAGVVGATVEQLAAGLVEACDLVAAVGPSIGPCCYQVDERVWGAFLAVNPASASWFSPDGPGHWRLDLWQATVDQLVSGGVPPESIHVARVCTADHLDRCFSYRREGAGTGRLVAAIRLRT